MDSPVNVITDSKAPWLIYKGADLIIDQVPIKVLDYLGQLNPGIHAFSVTIKPSPESSDETDTLGLLRISAAEAALERELQIRQQLVGYGMLAQLLASSRVESVRIYPDSVPDISTELAEVEGPNALNASAPYHSSDSANVDSENDLLTNCMDGSVTGEEVIGHEVANSELGDSAATSEEERMKGEGTGDEIADSGESHSILETEEASMTNVPPGGENQNTKVTEVSGETGLGVEPKPLIVAKAPSIEAKIALQEPLDEAEDTPLVSGDRSQELEEEFYPTPGVRVDMDGALLLLTNIPDADTTLATRLNDEFSIEESLSIALQVCQFFQYLYQRGWCFIHLFPSLVQLGKPTRFFDLSSAYPIGHMFEHGIIDHYCAPELAYGKTKTQESMSTYTVGALLYQLIHGKTLPTDGLSNIEICPIPHIYQLLKICLSSVPEERFPLEQLRDTLLNIRQISRTVAVKWDVASSSTVGLSENRLQNEDNYGVRQQQLGASDTLLLGVVADGMGGMAGGEIASQRAVDTVLSEPIPTSFKTDNQRAEWLLSIFEKANQSVTNAVRDGGTTLSLVLAVNQTLMLGHVGDSRIYLLRRNVACQLSEDHSRVAMLVASGELTPAESLEHPERNVLIRSLGSKQSLSQGYVQTLNRWQPDDSLFLEDNDIVLLCSDGVWDLVSMESLVEISTSADSLQDFVDTVMQQVLKAGATDNATLLALKFSHRSNTQL